MREMLGRKMNNFDLFSTISDIIRDGYELSFKFISGGVAPYYTVRMDKPPSNWEGRSERLGWYRREQIIIAEQFTEPNVVYALNLMKKSIDAAINKADENLNRPWHECHYEDATLFHDGTWEDGKWYEWKDCYGNVEIARMKIDAQDHFMPSAIRIREENVIAFREIKKED